MCLSTGIIITQTNNIYGVVTREMKWADLLTLYIKNLKLEVSITLNILLCQDEEVTSSLADSETHFLVKIQESAGTFTS